METILILLKIKNIKNIDYASVKRKIQSEKCKVHNEHPRFKKTQKGFDISACCTHFRSEMLKRTKTVMTEETKSALEKMIKKAFKLR